MSHRRFRFTVKEKHGWDATHDICGWEVSLPHQCEEWRITGEKYTPPVPHEVAVADLTAFIEEAQEALKVLMERREVVEE